MIIETSSNQLFRVRETGNADLEHVWIGVAVKRVKGEYVPKAKAREILVRKAGCRVFMSPEERREWAYREYDERANAMIAARAVEA